MNLYDLALSSDIVFLFMLSGLSIFCGLMAIMIIKDKIFTRIDVRNALADLMNKGDKDD